MKIDVNFDEKNPGPEPGCDGPAFSNFEDEELRARTTTTTCECGGMKFYVNFIQAPHSGCYVKLTCADCGKDEVLHDDYS